MGSYDSALCLCWIDGPCPANMVVLPVACSCHEPACCCSDCGCSNTVVGASYDNVLAGNLIVGHAT